MSELSGEILSAGENVDPEPLEEVQGPDRDAIARRAHEISQSETSGTDEENWHRAEAELRE